MGESYKEIPLNLIWSDSEFNSRGDFSLATVASLADEIERDGLIQPIMVQPLKNQELGTEYKIVVGHRRYAAHKLLCRKDAGKWGQIKSVISAEPLSEPAALLLNIQENLVREPLNMVQEARAVCRFKKWGWTVKRLAEALGQTKQWIEVRYGLLTLPQVIQDRAASGDLTQYQVAQVLLMPTPEDQYAYVRDVIDKRDKVEHLTGEEVAKSAKRGKTSIQIASNGESRTPAEMFLVQESIQDSFNDWNHPAAVALAWASGNMKYDDFIEKVRGWAEDQGIEYHEHAEIVKRAS